MTSLLRTEVPAARVLVSITNTSMSFGSNCLTGFGLSCDVPVDVFTSQFTYGKETGTSQWLAFDSLFSTIEPTLLQRAFLDGPADVAYGTDYELIRNAVNIQEVGFEVAIGSGQTVVRPDGTLMGEGPHFATLYAIVLDAQGRPGAPYRTTPTGEVILYDLADGFPRRMHAKGLRRTLLGPGIPDSAVRVWPIARDGTASTDSLDPTDLGDFVLLPTGLFRNDASSPAQLICPDVFGQNMRSLLSSSQSGNVTGLDFSPDGKSAFTRIAGVERPPSVLFVAIMTDMPRTVLPLGRVFPPVPAVVASYPFPISLGSYDLSTPFAIRPVGSAGPLFDVVDLSMGVVAPGNLAIELYPPRTAPTSFGTREYVGSGRWSVSLTYGSDTYVMTCGPVDPDVALSWKLWDLDGSGRTPFRGACSSGLGTLELTTPVPVVPTGFLLQVDTPSGPSACRLSATSDGIHWDLLRSLPVLSLPEHSEVMYSVSGPLIAYSRFRLEVWGDMPFCELSGWELIGSRATGLRLSSDTFAGASFTDPTPLDHQRVFRAPVGQVAAERSLFLLYQASSNVPILPTWLRLPPASLNCQIMGNGNSRSFVRPFLHRHFPRDTCLSDLLLSLLTLATSTSSVSDSALTVDVPLASALKAYSGSSFLESSSSVLIQNQTTLLASVLSRSFAAHFSSPDNRDLLLHEVARLYGPDCDVLGYPNDTGTRNLRDALLSPTWIAISSLRPLSVATTLTVSFQFDGGDTVTLADVPLVLRVLSPGTSTDLGVLSFPTLVSVDPDFSFALPSGRISLGSFNPVDVTPVLSVAYPAALGLLSDSASLQFMPLPVSDTTGPVLLLVAPPVTGGASFVPSPLFLGGTSQEFGPTVFVVDRSDIHFEFPRVVRSFASIRAPVGVVKCGSSLYMAGLNASGTNVLARASLDASSNSACMWTVPLVPHQDHVLSSITAISAPPGGTEVIVCGCLSDSTSTAFLVAYDASSGVATWATPFSGRLTSMSCSSAASNRLHVCGGAVVALCSGSGSGSGSGRGAVQWLTTASCVTSALSVSCVTVAACQDGSCYAAGGFASSDELSFYDSSGARLARLSIPGSHTIGGVTPSAVWLARLTPSGTISWTAAVAPDSSPTDTASFDSGPFAPQVSLTGDGGVVVSGKFVRPISAWNADGTCGGGLSLTDFDPLERQMGAAFVFKFSPTGTLQWAFRAPCTSAHPSAAVENAMGSLMFASFWAPPPNDMQLVSELGHTPLEVSAAGLWGSDEATHLTSVADGLPGGVFVAVYKTQSASTSPSALRSAGAGSGLGRVYPPSFIYHTDPLGRSVISGAAYGNGTYTVRSSPCFYSEPGSESFRAFDGKRGTRAILGSLVGLATYAWLSGAYQGHVSTSVTSLPQGQTLVVDGEWLEIELPYEISVGGLELTGCNATGFAFAGRHLTDDTWVVLDTRSGIDPNITEAISYSVDTSQRTFGAFRVIATSVAPSAGRLSVSEMRLREDLTL